MARQSSLLLRVRVGGTRDVGLVNKFTGNTVQVTADASNNFEMAVYYLHYPTLEYRYAYLSPGETRQINVWDLFNTLDIGQTIPKEGYSVLTVLNQQYNIVNWEWKTIKNLPEEVDEGFYRIPNQQRDEVAVLKEQWFDLDVDDLDDPVRFDISTVENQNVGELLGVSSQEFTLPGTERNNRFFQHVYETLGQDVPGLYRSIECVVTYNGTTLLRGDFQVNEITHEADGLTYYKVLVTNRLVTFKEALNNKFLRTADFGRFDHDYSIENVLNSWEGNLADGDIFYPLIDRGSDGLYPTSSVPGLLYNATPGSINNPNTPMQVQQFTPAIRTKALVDVIFDQAGFSYSSSFFDKDEFANTYVLFAGSENLGINVGPNQTIPNYGFATTIDPIDESNFGSVTEYTRQIDERDIIYNPEQQFNGREGAFYGRDIYHFALDFNRSLVGEENYAPDVSQWPDANYSQFITDNGFDPRVAFPTNTFVAPVRGDFGFELQTTWRLVANREFVGGEVPRFFNLFNERFDHSTIDVGVVVFKYDEANNSFTSYENYTIDGTGIIEWRAQGNAVRIGGDGGTLREYTGVMSGIVDLALNDGDVVVPVVSVRNFTARSPFIGRQNIDEKVFNISLGSRSAAENTFFKTAYTPLVWDDPESPIVVEIGSQVESNVKSVDLLQGILQKFNLIMYPHPIEDRTLIIDTFKDWIRKGQEVNWTNKLVTSDKMVIKAPISEQPQTIILTDEDDDDRFNVYAIENFPNFTYGRANYYSQTDLTEGERTIGSFFAPLILAPATQDPSEPLRNNTTTNEFSQFNTQGLVIPHLYKQEGERNKKAFRHKPRIGYRISGIPNPPYEPVGGDTYEDNRMYFGSSQSGSGYQTQTYATLSNYSHLNIFPSTEDIERQHIPASRARTEVFNTNFDDNNYKTYIYNGYVPGYKSTSNSVGGIFQDYTETDIPGTYESYWKEYLDSLYWSQSRKLTANIFFDPSEINSINLNNYYFIKNQYWRINKINGFNISEPDVAEVEFLAVYPPFLENIGFECLSGSLTVEPSADPTCEINIEE